MKVFAIGALCALFTFSSLVCFLGQAHAADSTAKQNCRNYSGAWYASCEVSAGDGSVGGSYLMSIKIVQSDCQSIQLPNVGYYPLRSFTDDVYRFPAIGQTDSSVIDPRVPPELQDRMTKSSQWQADGSLEATLIVDRSFSPKYWRDIEYRQKISLRDSDDGDYVLYNSNWATTATVRGQRQHAGARSVSCVLDKGNAN